MKKKDTKIIAQNTEKKAKLRLLRLPDSLDQAIQERAEKENRSVNSQIIHELSR